MVAEYPFLFCKSVQVNSVCKVFFFCPMKMYAQEQFFKDQIKIIHESREAKEEDFERMQQQERDKVKQFYGNPSNADENKLR